MLRPALTTQLKQIIERFYRDRDSLEPVSRDELRARLRKGSITVLDVRPADEYVAGHLPGAVSIPVNDIKRRLKEIPKSRSQKKLSRMSHL